MAKRKNGLRKIGRVLKKDTRKVGKAIQRNPVTTIGLATGAVVAGLGGAVIGGLAGYTIETKKRD